MKKFFSFCKSFYIFIRFDIWKITETELSRTHRYFYRLIKILTLAIRGFIDDRLTIRASALSYSVLFALVPMFALVVAFAKGFGAESVIENSLKGTYFDQINIVPTVMNFADRYLKTIHGGVFLGIGILILLWSVINFFMQVDNVFNSIWQVKKFRSPIRQFTTYFSAILIIPLIIIFSGGFSIFVSSSLSQSYIYHVLNPVLRLGFKLIPYFVIWVVFTIMYMAIPNTRVRFVNALIAGIIAGSAFQAFQMLYINGQVYLSRYNVVYGGFAALPLLLLWLQISGLIILLGAEISYASQNLQNYNFELDTKNISNRYKNFLTLFITYLVIKQFENEKPALSSEEISKEFSLPIRIVNQILGNLVEVGIFIDVISEKTKHKTYLPAFDINKMTVNMLYSRLDMNGTELFFNKKNSLLDNFWQKTLEIKQRSDEHTERILIKDI